MSLISLQRVFVQDAMTIDNYSIYPKFENAEYK